VTTATAAAGITQAQTEKLHKNQTVSQTTSGKQATKLHQARIATLDEATRESTQEKNPNQQVTSVNFVCLHAANHRMVF
jgi:hypothetical protein